jgi:hypothetical protein
MAKNKGFKGYKTEEQRYEQPKKGRGKPKYQNVVKESRVDTKAEDKATAKTVARIAGKKMTKKAASRRADRQPNLPKRIDREEKVRKGVRTNPPATKTPVKRSKAVRSSGGFRGGAGFLGVPGSRSGAMRNR